jgi:demethylmenaquinone methyltransferase/2-methoxy-6-polyprenyl-1,4-benzoquinol methylase
VPEGACTLGSAAAAGVRTGEAGAVSQGSRPGGAPGAQEAGSVKSGTGWDKAAFVPELFDSIAAHYDLMNVVMTAGFWWIWQQGFRRLAGIPAGSQVLDIGCGTAELSLLLADLVGPQGRVVGVDLSPGMLEVGRRKVARSSLAPRIELLPGDALALPFEDQRFDAAASAFVMRNVSDLDRALREAARVVRPGGRVAIMELSHPPASPLRAPFLFYFQRVLPLLGRWAARAGLPVAPYAWLPQSLQTFPGAEELAQRMEAAGLTQVRFHRMTIGAVCLHLGEVPGGGRP